jgi:cytochrome c-type biogenesis protein CcmH
MEFDNPVIKRSSENRKGARMESEIRHQKSDIRNRRAEIRLAFAIIVAALVWFGASPVAAQGPNIDDEVNRIAKGLYCPVCPNTPLDVCNTQACVQWRALIKEKLQKGESEQQIRAYFVQQYGDVVLGAPPAQGFNWLAYILPALGILLGGAAAWLTVRQWVIRRDAAAPAAPPEISKEYAERIEKELKEY